MREVDTTVFANELLYVTVLLQLARRDSASGHFSEKLAPLFFNEQESLPDWILEAGVGLPGRGAPPDRVLRSGCGSSYCSNNPLPSTSG